MNHSLEKRNCRFTIHPKKWILYRESIQRIVNRAYPNADRRESGLVAYGAVCARIQTADLRRGGHAFAGPNDIKWSAGDGMNTLVTGLAAYHSRLGEVWLVSVHPWNYGKWLYRVWLEKIWTVLLSTSLAWPAVAGCSRAETFSQLSSISLPQPCTVQCYPLNSSPGNGRIHLIVQLLAVPNC